MRRSTKLSIRIGAFSLGSLISAILFCLGCSVHEENRWGQSQDTVTHLLALGTYFSFLAFLISGLAFVVVLAKEK